MIKDKKYSLDIINVLKGLILKYGSDEEKDEILQEEDSKQDTIKVQTLKLTPDSPDFLELPKNIQDKRLVSIPEEELDNSLYFYDLFDLIKSKSLVQFGLPNISINDLILNNVNQAIIVVNKKGNIINIIANKEANTLFLSQIINNTLEHKLKQLPLSPKISNHLTNKMRMKHKLKNPSPFN
jgi:hypothetical protein